MSQDASSGGGGSSSDRRNASRSSTPLGRTSGRPNYMTVGSGSTSASAAALTAMLDNDSGYGGSVLGDGEAGSSMNGAWHPGLTEDRYTPSHTPARPGESSLQSENERRIMASHIHQLHYNKNRVALARAIHQTIETLNGLREMNSTWPAHYPSIQAPPSSTAAPSRPDPRPGLMHTQSMTGAVESQLVTSSSRPGAPRRAETSVGPDTAQEESSATASQRAPPSEPRLITPQAAQEFSILKLDLKVGGLNQSELVHSLEKQSIASLLDGKISQSIRHLLALRDRIEDTSSKVLVTGDLNAGKSTFCNALLRRKILPEDQQPCTSIFCEVLDCRENGGIEEVHAIPKDTVYNRHDESTYDVYPLTELETIVVDNDRYTQAKVYVRDIRTVNESILNNGVVDISIIDAPGLNMDSLKTTAVFARQEEIDVVVFVVSAANHFTLSAKEFIWNAAHEKAYLFIVVNGYDNIRDKERCQRMILEQVAHLSPRTFKESSELVHFVSSNAIPVAPAGAIVEGGSASGGGGGGDDPSDDGDDEGHDSSSSKGKGKEKEKIQDFENLEGALRRFVLEKRARSKLAPARTYLLNMLTDLQTLATVNRDVAQSELDRVTKELEELQPLFDQSQKAKTEVSDDIDKTIEDSCAEIYRETRERLSIAIDRVAEQDLGVPYPGLFNVFQYAEDIQSAMLEQISAEVIACEETARARTVQGVSTIKSLGLLHLGDEYTDMTFRSDVLFRRKRDILARQVDTEIEFWDFFDLNSLWERQEKVAGTGMAVTVFGVMGGRMIGGVSWLDATMRATKILGPGGLRKLFLPTIVLAASGLVAYAIYSIPVSLPRRLSSKLSAHLSALDYTHANSLRISSEVRKVLRYPADNLRVGLQRSIEKLGHRKEEIGKLRTENHVARKYFGNLINESVEIARTVERIDLEGPAPGIAAAYDP